MVVHAISLFSGAGMLDEGLRAGLCHLGVAHRTVCHVEREAYAAAVLVARMQEGSLAHAPVWSDVCTFDARAWRGEVDCIVAGFPCQDISVAGRRAGLDGKRSGLFFEVIRIATDSGAWLLALENVAGIATAAATVVDEEEGELEERAAARVVGELADLGWDAEWITLAASAVGASHRRERWFCLAWKREVDNTASARRDGTRQRAATNGSGGKCLLGEGFAIVADAARHVGNGLDGQGGSRRGICGAGDSLADTQRGAGERHGECRELECAAQRTEGQARQRQRCWDAADAGGDAVANAGCMQRLARPEQDRPAAPASGRHEGDDRHCVGGRELADTDLTRPQERAGGG